MKKIFLFFLVLAGLAFTISCKKEEKVTGKPSPLISVTDIKSMFNESPLVLKAENMMGATSICGIVISDPVNGNSPDGLVIVQSYRRKQLRGIALALGAEASQYTAGDSIVVKVDGATLERVNGMLQITKLQSGAIAKISANNEQKTNVIGTNFSELLKNTSLYENTLVKLQNAIFDSSTGTTTYAGDHIITDFFNNVTLRTNAQATFASEEIANFADYIGIAYPFVVNGAASAYIQIRSLADVAPKVIEPYRPGQLYANFPEGWEVASSIAAKTSASGGNKSEHKTGVWNMTGSAYILTGAQFKKDARAAMFPVTAAEISMNFDVLYGASKVSFYYAIANPTNANDMKGGKVQASYSVDGGATWVDLGPKLEVPTSNLANLYFAEYTLDIRGPFRLRFVPDPGYGRVAIDDIAIYQN